MPARVHKYKALGAPAWMVTFADLMALLMALFVMLLSFSEIDSDSFRRNAGPISQAFNAPQVITLDPAEALPLVQFDPVDPFDEEAPEDPVAEERRAFLIMLKQAMDVEIQRQVIDIEEQDPLIIMRFPAAAAFGSGDADLMEAFGQTLDKLAGVLARVHGQIIISGHTDDRPIQSGTFRSNWDLSTSRAVSVVHRLLEYPEMNPGRVTAQGFADTRPRAANDRAENRALNRRVEISVEVQVKPD